MPDKKCQTSDDSDDNLGLPLPPVGGLKSFALAVGRGEPHGLDSSLDEGVDESPMSLRFGLLTSGG